MSNNDIGGEHMHTINDFTTLERRIYYFIRNGMDILIESDQDEDYRNIEALLRRASMKFNVSVEEIEEVDSRVFNALYLQTIND